MLFIGLPRLPIKMRCSCANISIFHNPLSQPIRLPWVGVGGRATGTALGSAGAAAREVLPLQPQTEEELTLQPSLARHPQIWESAVSFLQLLCCSSQSKVVTVTAAAPLSISLSPAGPEKALVTQQTKLWNPPQFSASKLLPNCAHLELQGGAAPGGERPELS